MIAGFTTSRSGPSVIAPGDAVEVPRPGDLLAERRPRDPARPPERVDAHPRAS
jgi:hypothetical protein